MYNVQFHTSFSSSKNEMNNNTSSPIITTSAAADRLAQTDAGNLNKSLFLI